MSVNVDPFWFRVQEAYREVANEPNRKIEIEMNGMKALVCRVPEKFNMPLIGVFIDEVEVEQPTLISPQ